MKLIFTALLAVLSLSAFSQVVDTLPVLRAQGRDDGVAVYLKGKIYGGTGFSSSFTPLGDWWSYDIAGGEWQALADVPFTPRQYVRAFRYEKYIYLFGGSSDAENFFNDLWRYDTDSDTWKRMADLPAEKRWAAFAFVIENKAYVGMGVGESGVLSDWYEYDIAEDLWRQQADFPGGARARGVGVSVNGAGVIGMGDCGDSIFFNDFWRYIPRTDRWLKLDIEPDEKLNYVNHCTSGQNLYVYGGTDSVFEFSPSFWKVNLWEKSISKTDSLPLVKTRGGSMVSDDEGNLYLLWGLRSDGSKSSSLYRIRAESMPQEVSGPFIYPNPAKNYAYLQFPKDVSKVFLSEGNGKVIKEISVEERGYLYVHTDDLAAGLYFVRCCRGGESCYDTLKLLIHK